MNDTITLPRATVQQALEALEYENGWHEQQKEKPYGSTLDAMDALRRVLEQPEQPNPWRDAVDHELSTLHMVASDDPRESIRRLIDWHCAVQIDPLVSSAAQELIERGRREALEQPEQEPVADRAAFERHAESLGYSVDKAPTSLADSREGPGYWSSHTHLMWETWQAALEQPEQPNPWRDAVDHELSTLHMVASDDPRESIRRLIDWHCAVQIDPLVSSAAQELIERGRREAPEQDTDCHAQGICQRSGYGIAEPEQEPVDIKPPNPEGATQCIVRWWAETPAGWVGAWDREALDQFTHPPRREWRSLSEEEIDAIQWHGSPLQFARAFEAALRSKNHE